MKETIILGIETSCDETSAAIVKNENLLSNVMPRKRKFTKNMEVVPEIASRKQAHYDYLSGALDAKVNVARYRWNCGSTGT